MNPVEIEEAVSDLAREPFDRAEFPFQFLAAFDNPETTIKRLRSGSTNQSDVPEGVLQRSNIHIATCDLGEVDATLKALRDSPKTASAKAKFILATDGASFQAEDLNGGGTVACSYAEFPDHFGFFLPLAGITTVKEIRESSFDVKATGRLNRLYVQLLKENPDWATAERQRDMNHFMARLIFCFFAEDTDIFLSEGLFTKQVEQLTAGDAASTHKVIGEIFRAMDTKPADRAAAGLPNYAVKFPYVNGHLFSGSTEVPRFSKVARSYLMHIGSLNWKKINPDIFGSMIQAVTDDEERGSLGMHYTSVPNILKVLNPLFLDDLRQQLEEAGDSGRKLLNLRNRMARIRVFDPACGSGNFLVIAYKEMRGIEAAINKRRGESDRRSDISIKNFRGIELRDFPAEIARLALIIAEFQCDVLCRGQKEAVADFLPLGSESWITCGNALRLDWLSICPPTGTGVKVLSDDLFQTPLDQAEIDFDNEGGETYICGNPPFKGARKQTPAQKDDMSFVFGGGNDYKDCDYVTGWYLKASYYSSRSQSDFAFVSTNSISRGEQVSHLWSRLYADGNSIHFCHTQFRWANNASNNAGVWCVIIGATKSAIKPRQIFEDGMVRVVDSISPYLIPGDESYIVAAEQPLAPDLPRLVSGSMARDGGNLILEEGERRSLVEEFPKASPLLRPLIGTSELRQGGRRWCIWVEDDQLDLALSFAPIAQRIEATRAFRSASSAKTTQGYAKIAHKFAQRAHQHSPSIVMPKNTPEGLPYLTPVYEPERTISTDLAFVSYTEKLWVVAVLSSNIHRVWAEAISGGLGSGVRYSSQIAYNTFPLDRLTRQNLEELARCAENILLAREKHFPNSIAELYDPEKMPEDLIRAHEANDEVLERIYIGRRFRNDTERLEKLFELYTRMTGNKAA